MLQAPGCASSALPSSKSRDVAVACIVAVAVSVAVKVVVGPAVAVAAQFDVAFAIADVAAV